MISQIELDLTARETLTDGDTDHLARVLQILEANTGWLNAAQILVNLGLETAEWRKRWLRGLIEHADGKIISGQAGYRATIHATADEIHHAAAWLRHQAQRMDHKAGAILRAGHHILNRGNP